MLCVVWCRAPCLPRREKAAGQEMANEGERKRAEKKTGSTHGKNGSTLRGKCRVESLRHCREGFCVATADTKKKGENKVCVLSGHDAENAQRIEIKKKRLGLKLTRNDSDCFRFSTTATRATFFVPAKWPRTTVRFDNLRLANGHVLAQANQRERGYVL